MDGEETTTGDETEVTTTEGDETAAGNETAGGAENETGTGTQTGTAGGEDVPSEVAMITDGSDYLFDPIGLYVEPGEEITWVNDSGSHSSTAYVEGNSSASVTRIPEEAEGWDSGTLSEEGATFSHTFEVEGTYDYFCIPHKTLGMVARIVVGEPSGLEGDPPDGLVPSEQRIVEEGVVTQEEFNP